MRFSRTLASAETQVRARAVLPGSGSSEHQATGALPQSAASSIAYRRERKQRAKDNKRAEYRELLGVLSRSAAAAESARGPHYTHLTRPGGVLSVMACLQQSDFGRVFGSCGA